MLKKIYKYMAAFLLVGLVVSCSPDALSDVPLSEGDVPIEVTGMLTRALGDANDPGHGQLITTGNPLGEYNATNFYLSARTTDATPANYFLNQKITIGNNLAPGRNELDGTVYYPLGKKPINLIAHTGGLATTEGVITLNAGTEQTNDYLFGKGTLDDGKTLKTGTSVNPVEYITFKHLMTRVDVKIVVDDNVESIQPSSMTMRFSRTAGQIVDRGTYNIFTDGNENGNAVNNPTNNDFSFSNIGTTPTTYYLVPNGANLTTFTGQIISHLQIDDYTATQEDREALKFSQANKDGVLTDFILNPGLAYDLTFVINRLKIVDIQLTMKDWDAKPATTEWDYTPKTVTLNTGDYLNNTEPSKISKMVLLHTNTDNETYQYIGAGKMDGGVNKIDFVTLPADFSSGTLTAALYTDQGLLAYNMDITVSGNEFTVIDMNKYGMKKAIDGDYLEISTSLQLGQFISDEVKPDNQHYKLVDDLDMGHTTYKITPQSFPAGSTLDGNGYDIIQLEVEGNGLFTVNNGKLKNVRIASGLIQGTDPNLPMGAICQTNNGIIEAVVNQAYIQPADNHGIVGGIAGENGEEGTILATVNTGDVLGGTTVGGIVGDNKNPSEGAVKASLNIGLLNNGATTLGGIIGTSVDGTTNNGIVNTCAWLTGTARKKQSVSDELVVGNNAEGGSDTISADLAASRIRSQEVINRLSAAGAPWEFRLYENLSSWPIAIKKPTNP